MLSEQLTNKLEDALPYADNMEHFLRNFKHNSTYLVLMDEYEDMLYITTLAYESGLLSYARQAKAGFVKRVDKFVAELEHDVDIHISGNDYLAMRDYVHHKFNIPSCDL